MDNHAAVNADEDVDFTGNICFIFSRLEPDFHKKVRQNSHKFAHLNDFLAQQSEVGIYKIDPTSI